MELPNLKILDEKNKLLHQKSKDVVFPLSSKDKQNILDMITYLQMSQIDEYNKLYHLKFWLNTIKCFDSSRKCYTFAASN